MASETVLNSGDDTKHPSQTHSYVTYNEKRYRIAKEGSAEILELQRPEDSKPSRNGGAQQQSVFYNPIQQYNRDLSVLAIKAFGEDFAAVREARPKRLAKEDKRGKKRKRSQSEEANGDENNATTRSKTYRESMIGNGEAIDPIAVENEITRSRTSDRGEQDSIHTDPKQSNGMQDSDDQRCGTLPRSTPKGPKHITESAARETDPPFRILDALSATGLRALRYAKEIHMVTSVTANDLSTSATASIRLNVQHNKLDQKIVANKSDAIEHMHFAASPQHPLYEVIDLDPYGTAAPFLDAAIQALVDGGMLCVTCTDASIFASTGFPEKTYSQYGGLPLKGPHAHEGGLRLVLHAIATSAARYGFAIEPLLSLSIDFYVRIFVRFRRSAVEVKHLASKTMIVYNCDAGCSAWSIQNFAKTNRKEAKNGDIVYTHTQALAPSGSPLCEHCGFKTHLGGPMWGGPVHNQHFIQRILDMLPTLDKSVYGTIPRIEGMLSLAIDEFVDDTPSVIPKSRPPPIDRPVPPIDPATISHHPFFFLPSVLSGVLHCVSPSDAAVRGALRHLGYRTTKSHTKAGSICTDAPWSVIWEIMREWARQRSPVKEGAIKERTAGWGIMQKDRSKFLLNDAKHTFQKILDNPEIRDFDELEKDMEAALFRVSKMVKASHDQADPGQTPNGHADVQSGGDHKGETNDATKETEVRAVRNEKDATPRIPKIPMETRTSQLKIVFDERLGKEGQGKHMVRYQVNPRADWGPMNRAKGGP